MLWCPPQIKRFHHNPHAFRKKKPGLPAIFTLMQGAQSFDGSVGKAVDMAHNVSCFKQPIPTRG
jgi:hypothetical protein